MINAVKSQGAMPPAMASCADFIPLRAAANQLGLTPLGSQKLLARIGALHRNDGRWFVSLDLVQQIKAARSLLQLSKGRGWRKNASENRPPLESQLPAIEAKAAEQRQRNRRDG